jgi:hypothetical protein
MPKKKPRFGKAAHREAQQVSNGPELIACFIVHGEKSCGQFQKGCSGRQVPHSQLRHFIHGKMPDRIAYTFNNRFSSVSR